MYELIKISDNNGKKAVSARELYEKLGFNKSNWVKWYKKNILENPFATENEDWAGFVLKMNGNDTQDFALSIGFAKKISMMARTSKGEEVRNYFKHIEEGHEKGTSFTVDQIGALLDITKAMVLVSVQKDVEKRHFVFHNNKLDWWDYRSKIIGISTESLTKAMSEVNKKHKSIRSSLMKLDPHELIRVGVVDLFIALGKPDEYANNVANLCKTMSQKINQASDFWDDTKEDSIGIRKIETSQRKEFYVNSRITNKQLT